MQSASTIAMIRPAAFGYNQQTAVNNHFQDKNQVDNEALQPLALQEFDAMVALLKEKKIEVIVLQDTASPAKPDAVFPNNWFTCRDAVLHVFPMYAPNRRLEKRKELIEELKDKTGCKIIKDWSSYESKGLFLEGTGSMIFDHENKCVYACLSSRTNKQLFTLYASEINYKAICFEASDEMGNEIYHTNVMMCIGSGYAIVCMDAVKNTAEKKLLLEQLHNTGHKVVSISFSQMKSFAGNMLQLTGKDAVQYLLMSRTAYRSLSSIQLQELETFSSLIVPDVSAIEKAGGGSVRCMVAEIFN
ncbi:MAG: amidinotransferase [Bacteroidetes bacterium]|nr:amidinotransferase [Bacteroidota bacterium]